MYSIPKFKSVLWIFSYMELFTKGLTLSKVLKKSLLYEENKNNKVFPSNPSIFLLSLKYNYTIIQLYKIKESRYKNTFGEYLMLNFLRIVN